MTQRQRDKHQSNHELQRWLRPIVDPFVTDLIDMLKRESVQLRSGNVPIPDTVPVSHSVVIVMAVVETKHAQAIGVELYAEAANRMDKLYGPPAKELTKTDTKGNA